MNYQECEIAIADYISDNWDADLAKPIDEYITKEYSSSIPTMTINAGFQGGSLGCFGKFDEKRFDILSGTVNLNFKFPIDYGKVKVTEILQAAVTMLNHKVIQSYITFDTCYVADTAAGTYDGKKYKTV